MNLSRLLYVLLVAFLTSDVVLCRRGGGGGGRASSGRMSSGSSRSSYGSSSSSGSSYGRVSSSSGSTATRYGSSAPSGSGSGFSSGGGFGSSRSGIPSGTAYRAQSRTMARLSARPGVGRSSAARPQAQIPRATQSQPTKVVYSTTYVNNYGSSYGRSGYGGGSMLLAGGAGLIGGMYLGSVMSRMSHPYGYGYGGGYGYPSPYSTYVPYRNHYGSYYETTTPSPLINTNQAALNVPVAPKKDVDLCTLARWNRELPFAEMPNMIIEFLANDTVSNATTSEKARFVYDFFKSSTDAYAAYDSASDIFTIPSGYDLSQCNFGSTQNFNPTSPAGNVEEPILTAARAIINTYSNASKDADALKDVVDAAKLCLPRGGVVSQPQVLPCLDFTLNPDQLLKLEEPHSIFGSGEICRRSLNPDMFKCVPAASEAGACKLEHLVALNAFARNYYLCSSELEKDTMDRIEASRLSDNGYYGSAPRAFGSSILMLWTASLLVSRRCLGAAELFLPREISNLLSSIILVTLDEKVL
ncbi:hypothetical protein BV898_11900 [Hypsibius exemplaris]|uniref:Uncharacterized protein n=1 Tax=Hypsibius exemplaris TaxID=2072580 RepID=A0A1W0WFB6_HYPEX|nr:hypothetical protein BV898_11900 [Hypsibius exemplaris]